MAKQNDHQKGLRYLSRSELIEIIYRQQLLVEDLQQRLSDSKEKIGELSEQIRTFESNRSLSARTEQLGENIQIMAKQLDALNDIIRRNYPARSGVDPAAAPADKPVMSAPRKPLPNKSVHPVPPPAVSVPPVRRAKRIIPPLPVPPAEPAVSSATSNRRFESEKPVAPAPTIAQQLKGKPVR